MQQIPLRLVVVILILYACASPSIFQLLDGETYLKFNQLKSGLQNSKNDTNNSQYERLLDELKSFQQKFSIIEIMILYKGEEAIILFREYSGYFGQILASLKTRFTQLINFIRNTEPQKKKQTNFIKKNAFNFANLDGGAIMLEAHYNVQNPENALRDNKDSYLMANCVDTDLYMIFSLKEEVQIQTIQLINKELYSSTVKNFEVYGSLMYPTEEWIFLGNFTAENGNEWQSFQLQPHFASYIKIVFKTFYLDEHFCIVTQLKIFGQTVMAEMVEQNTRTKEETILDPPKEEKIIIMQEIPDPDHQIDELFNDMKVLDLSSNLDVVEHQEVSTMQGQGNCMGQISNGQCGQQQYYWNLTCTYLDYLINNTTETLVPHKHRETQFINVLPYYSNQSIVKVTAQNIMILQHNQDLLKSVIIELQKDVFEKRKQLKEAQEKVQQVHHNVSKNLSDIYLIMESLQTEVRSSRAQLDQALVQIINLQHEVISKQVLIYIAITLVALTILFACVIVKRNNDLNLKFKEKEKVNKTQSTLKPPEQHEIFLKRKISGKFNTFHHTHSEQSSENELFDQKPQISKKI